MLNSFVTVDMASCTCQILLVPRRSSPIPSKTKSQSNSRVPSMPTFQHSFWPRVISAVRNHCALYHPTISSKSCSHGGSYPCQTEKVIRKIILLRLVRRGHIHRVLWHSHTISQAVAILGRFLTSDPVWRMRYGTCLILFPIFPCLIMWVRSWPLCPPRPLGFTRWKWVRWLCITRRILHSFIVILSTTWDMRRVWYTILILYFVLVRRHWSRRRNASRMYLMIRTTPVIGSHSHRCIGNESSGSSHSDEASGWLSVSSHDSLHFYNIGMEQGFD